MFQFPIGCWSQQLLYVWTPAGGFGEEVSSQKTSSLKCTFSQRPSSKHLPKPVLCETSSVMGKGGWVGHRLELETPSCLFLPVMSFFSMSPVSQVFIVSLLSFLKRKSFVESIHGGSNQRVLVPSQIPNEAKSCDETARGHFDHRRESLVRDQFVLKGVSHLPYLMKPFLL